jgi:hypothetical protein
MLAGRKPADPFGFKCTATVATVPRLEFHGNYSLWAELYGWALQLLQRDIITRHPARSLLWQCHSCKALWTVSQAYCLAQTACCCIMPPLRMIACDVTACLSVHEAAAASCAQRNAAHRPVCNMQSRCVPAHRRDDGQKKACSCHKNVR